MLRALPRASSLASSGQGQMTDLSADQGPEEAFQSWLDMALQGSRDIWIGAPEGQV